jgi:TolB-like protein
MPMPRTRLRPTAVPALLARCLLTACLLAGCLVACGGPMHYVHPTADLSYITRVAVAPLQNLTEEKHSAEKVMNVVATELLRRGLEVVEFGEVDKVLRGEGFGRDGGAISKTVAANAGKRLGVQAFITGAVHEYGFGQGKGNDYPEVTVSLKLIDASSCAILWEANHSVKGTTVLDRLLGIDKQSPSDLCRQVVVEMLDTLFGSRGASVSVDARRRG